MTKTLFNKGIAGAPSLVHTPGDDQLANGGKRRSKRGRAALFNKDGDGGGGASAGSPVGANSVHAETALGNERKRRSKEQLSKLTEINAKIQKDWTAFDEARAANAPGRRPAAPKQDSLARASAQALSAAAPHVAGSIAGEAGGAVAGRYIGGLLGAGLGPAGAIAGSFAGGVAGDYVGRKIADAVFGASKENALGGSLGSSIGATIGYTAADRLLPGSGQLAAAVSRVLGTAAGDVAGTRFGNYVSQRVGGVLAMTKGQLATRYGSDTALDIGSDLATVGRFSKSAKVASDWFPPGTKKDALSDIKYFRRLDAAGPLVAQGQAGSPFPPLKGRYDANVGTWEGEAAANTRFRTALLNRETKQRNAAGRLALFGPQRPENMQPRRDEPYQGFRQRLNQVLAEQQAGAFPWSSAMSKRRRLFEDK